VRLGSRAAERAVQAAADLRVAAGVEHVTGHANAECVTGADIVLVVVPYEGHRELLASLRDEMVGKVVVDCVNPMGFDGRGPFPLGVPEGSAAQQAEKILPESTVVAAFHHVSAVLLGDTSVSEVDTDVLVLGDDRAATDLVRGLAGAIPGMRGVYGGRLRNAHQVEALTANLIAVNRRYDTHAGLRVTGL
jgi:NADPH-dependent F420 reductase